MSTIIKLTKNWALGNEIGSGGFGKVYLANTGDGNEAVLKLIPKMPGADRELLFVDLNNVPNIVPVFDRGEWDNYWVIVMPRAGHSLRAYLEKQEGQMPADNAIEILIDIAEALVGIEDRIVHRDIKPENILFLGDHWCLSDFGIARYAEATTAPDTHKYKMTLPYAAPEQWRNERATAVTDVYSTGIVAYEMLAGSRPFVGPAAEDFRQQHLHDTPTSISGITQSLQSIIDECFYKAPEARPRPQNLLARLKKSVQPKSEAGHRIETAYQEHVAKQVEENKLKSIAQSEKERLGQLFRAGKQSFDNLSEMLFEQIIASAPGIEPKRGTRWPCILNGAELSMNSVQMFEALSINKYDPPFEVVAYSSITIRIPTDRYGYEGRAHSLWYCDAHEPGVFRWYETAFMFNPLTSKSGKTNPFDLKPGDESFGALSMVMNEFQVDWPFVAIDQGDENEFIERWLTWFADAAQGRLSQPRSMPERNTRGSWRGKH